jgi:hypothetical protein
MTQILRYYFTTVKIQYCSKPRSVWFHWKDKIYVETREKKTEVPSGVSKTPKVPRFGVNHGI